MDRMEKALVTVGPNDAFRHFDKDLRKKVRSDLRCLRMFVSAQAFAKEFGMSSVKMHDQLLLVCASDGDHSLAMKTLNRMNASGLTAPSISSVELKWFSVRDAGWICSPGICGEGVLSRWSTAESCRISKGSAFS